MTTQIEAKLYKLLRQQELSLVNSRVCSSGYLHIPMTPSGSRKGGCQKAINIWLNKAEPSLLLCLGQPFSVILYCAVMPFAFTSGG